MRPLIGMWAGAISFHKHGENAPSLLNADLDPAVGHILQTAMRFCLKAQTS